MSASLSLLVVALASFAASHTVMHLTEAEWIVKAREAYANAPIKPNRNAVSNKPTANNLRNSCSARHLLSSAKCPLTGLTGDLISADSLLDGGVDVPGVGNFTFVLKENQADESKIVHTCKPNNRLENTTPLVVYQQMYCFRPDPDIVAFGTVNTMKDQEGQLFVGCTDKCPWTYNWNVYASNALAMCLPNAHPMCARLLQFCTPDNFYA